MNKKFWMTAFLFGLQWALFMIVLMAIVNWKINARMIVIYLIAGAFAGILFSWVMQIVGRRLMKKITITLPDHEVILMESAANHLIKREGVGGKLVLTENKLIFQSHQFNIQNHQQIFDLKNIVNMSIGTSLFILENRLMITLNNQEKHIFIVDEPAEWIRNITNRK